METRKLHISSGRGPVECMWVTAQVVQKLREDAEKQNLTVLTVQEVEGPQKGTYASVSLLVEGFDAGAFVSEWTGSILWRGESRFRPRHKRKNWFVEVFDRAQSQAIVLHSKDLRIDTFRASGPGGQHVNKTDSAIRVTHVPTGWTVPSQNERSQLQNKKVALARLEELFHAKREEQERWEQKDQWKQGIQVRRGNPVRTYAGPKFKRIK